MTYLYVTNIRYIQKENVAKTFIEQTNHEYLIYKCL
jgi:hypothetical protein